MDQHELATQPSEQEYRRIGIHRDQITCIPREKEVIHFPLSATTDSNHVHGLMKMVVDRRASRICNFTLAS